MIKLASDRYLVRTPLYPTSLADLCYTQDITALKDRKEFMYGIYLSSKALYEEFQKELSVGKVPDKMKHSLQKYWVRASARCTPYANFAGCSLGTIGDATDIFVEDPLKHKEACRLDMDLIFRFLEVLYRDPKITSQIKYFTNSSLYIFAGRYRYVRYKFNGKRNYFLSELEANFYLEEIVKLCCGGATISDIQAYLQRYEVPSNEAAGFISEIIRNQVLVSELEPNVSGDEPFKQLAKILGQYTGTEYYVQLIDYLNQKLSSDPYDISRLEDVIDTLKDSKISVAVNTLFQVDINTRTSSNTISAKAIQTVLDQINELAKILNLRVGRPEALENFKRRFLERYDYQTIPLFEALDVENGVGYGNAGGDIHNFIGDIKFGADAGSNVNKAMEFITKVVSDRVGVSFEPIQLAEADLKVENKKNSAPERSFALQQNLYLMGTLLGRNGEAIDNGEFQFWAKMVGGTSHANLLSRFAHIDAEIGTWIKSLTMSEEKELPDDMIYAEIVHLPQERIGNISQRPHLRSYEITYMGNSDKDREYQIPVSDILVSIEAGSIVLRSKKLNKKILPRLTNAHNYSSDGLPIYKFLCDMQHQDSFGGIGFERLFNINGPFSPRVMFKNLILKRASWKITKDDIDGAKKEKAITNILALKDRRNIPQKVVIQQSDNELLIDFSYRDAVEIFAGYLEKYGSVQISEFLGDEQNCFIKGKEGCFTNELIIPVKVEKAKDNQAARQQSQKSAGSVKRTFIPGDEWLYYKVYCSNNIADELLVNEVNKLVQRLLSKKMIDKFFFIRYADPERHIRLRFRLTDTSHFLSVSQMLANMLNKYVRERFITRLQLDTYVRELERYGFKTMEPSESVFFNDSMFVLETLKSVHEHSAEDHRWIVALAGIDEYLENFGYSIDRKITLLERMQRNFFNEFGAGESLHHSLNDKHRALKNALFAILKDRNHEALATYQPLLQKRSRLNIPLAATIKKVHKGDEGMLDDLLMSYIHMFVNRLFISDNRKYELVLYHLLHKYYTSAKAIMKNQNIRKKEVV